jgi:DNA-binding HxlR family transcriptional regulator
VQINKVIAKCNNYFIFMEKKRSDCPISCSLDIFGDKWSLLIIRDIMLRGKASYSEFLISEEKIATNILVNRLSVLESEKILVKEVSPANKSKFVYSLTQKGADLLPIIIEIMDWGARYNENCPRKELGKKIKKDKLAVVKELSQELKKKVKLF